MIFEQRSGYISNLLGHKGIVALVFKTMNVVQRLPGKLIRISRLASHAQHIRIFPTSSILYVEAHDDRIHIQYKTPNQYETLIFSSKEDVNKTMSVLEQELCDRGFAAPPVTDYPFPE